mmetsp:Transcript_38830/g.57124  ORF Transcript_38830/g.57124 Transcript_38830/m.57124 type:complete len:148 (+) Transcript_38830:164-607(+)|eukprot:CAMPEP_0195507944 /NCGR_PEP_ID=MMETSP0794_2-20130614/1282_1 /TAXON_ID=515487 /ORGANISM="Stephanopyxis turris, Strain CCMP 815" /LENGTH=147 /DNA_ID=CAMNT_0040634779 /DNA_START=148 /DNA_END=591 /DNA_ORIENTATION=-
MLDLLTPLGDALAFLHSNAWSIVICVFVFFVLKTHVFGQYLEDRKHAASLREANDPKRVSLLSADMKRVRAAQQEETQRKAADAKEAAHNKRIEEMKRKKVDAPKKPGTKLGGEGSSNRTGYNAMNPSSGYVRGYTGPTRRNPSRSS